MPVWALAAVIVGLSVPTGCAPAATPGPTEPETPAEPEAPVLPACVDNVDCQGGEVCRDDVCRTACGNDDECTGFYNRCDTGRGICVACTDNDHCESDEACTAEGLCAFFCSDDEQCAANEFCEEGAGACLDRECDVNGDCPGGFSCEDFRCVNLDPIICESESVTCDGDTVVTCSRDGTGEERVACETGFVCTEANDQAACLEQICEPNSVGCIDDDNAFACDGTGTDRTSLACRVDQFCTAGICQNQLCIPDAITCEGNSLVTCDSVGATRDTQVCGETTACIAEAFGCSCVIDACVPRVCRPEGRECVGNGFRTCDALGTGFGTPETCADSCLAGACVSSSCVAGENLCAGDSLLVCNAGGDGYDLTDCALAGETCVTAGDTSSCAAPICEPLATTCTDDFTGVVTCNAFGTASTAVACGDDQFCEAGLCQAEICAPGATECVGTTSVRTCSALGDVETVTNCDAGQTCSEGVCSTPVCTPDCAGRVCGPDPVCGESCGPCDGVCTPTGQCEAVGDGDLEIEVTWDQTADLDLHLAQGTDAFCADDSCYYATCTPNEQNAVEWDGVVGRTGGDPVLAIDSTTTGPERITIAAPDDGVFRARVHHYPSNAGSPPTTATLVVRAGGAEVASFSKSLDRRDVWDSVVITWSGTNAIAIDEDNTTVFPGAVCTDIEPTDGGPGPDVDGGPNTVCTVNADCPASQFCATTLIFGTCVDGCRDDNGCNFPSACNGNGECVSGALSDWQGSCSANADCRAGLACGLLSACIEFCATAGACNAANPCCEVSGAAQCSLDLLGGFIATCGN